jgi:hypothetical protein
VSADFEAQLTASRSREAQLVKEAEVAKTTAEADMRHATNVWEAKINEARSEKTRIAGQAASLKKDYQRLVQKEQSKLFAICLPCLLPLMDDLICRPTHLLI